MSEKRYLILAEGHSGDPHYGKTARGVIRYAPDPTVAIVDSRRAGELQDGIPIVAGLAFELIKLFGKNRTKRWARILMWPGMQLQKLTTAMGLKSNPLPESGRR